MIISERRGFAFLHNPKCGGTTVRRALSRFDTTGNFFWGFDEWQGHKIDKAHLPLFILKSKYPSYFTLFTRCFSFMFVRNPYQRAISAFNETHQHLLPAVRSAESSAPASVNAAQYRSELNKFLSNLAHDSLTVPSYQCRHLVRQIDLAYIGNKRFVDLVMKLEELPECLRALRVFLPDAADIIEGAEARHRLPMRGTWRDYLDDQSITKINSIYHDDFSVFDYQTA